MSETKKLIKGMRALAIHAGVHYNTIYQWNREGLLKVRKRIKKTLFFDPDDYFSCTSSGKNKK